MVSVHTWEEESICSYIERDMHAATRVQVRRQVVEWWRYLKSFLRAASRDAPITLPEVQALTHRMMFDRVMCPFWSITNAQFIPCAPSLFGPIWLAGLADFKYEGVEKGFSKEACVTGTATELGGIRGWFATKPISDDFAPIIKKRQNYINRMPDRIIS